MFVTTHWSVVVAAGRTQTADSRGALAKLCETYWFPLYAFVRRRGYSPEDAEDLTQEFFSRLLQHNWVADADQAKGRFRTFLLAALTRFLANEWDKVRAQKRGGGAKAVQLDTALAEGRYTLHSTSPATPDQFFDRQWAMTLLERTLHRLQSEHDTAGKSDEFKSLSPFLTAERGAIPYAELAEKLKLTEATARQAVHRLRKRFREVFREEIQETIAAEDELEDEIRYLLSALS